MTVRFILLSLKMKYLGNILFQIRNVQGTEYKA